MTRMADGVLNDRAPEAMIAGAIPLIDVAGHLAGDAESSRKAATQLRWAFENVGFYYLSGHGVPRSLIDRTYEAAARFHAQPIATKLALWSMSTISVICRSRMRSRRRPPRRAASRARTKP